MLRMYRILCIFSIIYIQSTITAFSWKNLYHSFIPGKEHEELVYKQYKPEKITIVTIKNKRGNISVKTDKNQNIIFLKAIKKAYDPTLLPQLTFIQKTVGQEFIIEATYNENDIVGSIDFELIVPHKLAINANTLEGSIAIQDTQAPIRVSTQKGPIEIAHAANSIEAVTYQRGSITIQNPQGRVKAQTNSGNISLLETHSTIIAETKQGAIELFAREIPSTSTINLTTVSGSIILHLPQEVNADLQAYTKQGIITSDHFITLKPQTIQLNRQAWKRLQKQIDGILGTGEAQIKLSSIKSDIKLFETKNPSVV